ncbi:hypothetical protein Gorai_024698, partial [Gossypium raimondii]|nr:hypothetical protein [Gossypium raimondii]
MQYLITHFSDFQLASLGSFFLHESVFFLSGLPFIYLERAGLLSKYKIQVNSLHCWKVVLSQIIFYFILEDFVFYWGHLFSLGSFACAYWLLDMHTPYRYATPFGLTSEYAHPAEILFLGFATIIGPAITGPHLITLWLWMTLRVLETVEAHCGYHFPW